jgi:3-phenylpropionate/cinnamic acid dioxygenase small subunit
MSGGAETVAPLEPGGIVLINQLVALYGHIVDAAEWHRFPELFVPEAELDYTSAGAPEVCHGIEAITEFFRGANHPSAHHCVNVYVDDSDGLIRVTSKFFSPYTRATHVPPRWKGGNYFDVVELTAAGWRFRSRTCVATWQLVGEPDEERVTW